MQWHHNKYNTETTATATATATFQVHSYFLSKLIGCYILIHNKYVNGGNLIHPTFDSSLKLIASSVCLH